MSSASSALSIPDALSADGLSKEPRALSMPRPEGFFSAFFAPEPLGLEGREASSWARRAAFSAFLRAASAAFSAAASLKGVSVLFCGEVKDERTP